MGFLNEYLGFVEKVDKRIRNEKLTEMLARAELTHRSDFTSKQESEVPPKLVEFTRALPNWLTSSNSMLNKPVEDEEHHTWSICFTDSQGAGRCIDWNLASSPEFRQMMAKYTQIKEFLEPPFLIEFAPKGGAAEAGPDGDEGKRPTPEGNRIPGSAEVSAEAKAKRAAPAHSREPVEKQTARELFTYIVEQGKKDYQVQRYKGLGEMTASQLWETTMDPEHRTLLSVKLEDIAETEAIFTTLMGEDVEARRKFIEDNALDVKNLDI